MDEEVIKLYLRMDSRFAAWAVRVARFPASVWHTHTIYNIFHYIRLGAAETHPSSQGLARPTKLGIDAARLYCEQTGLRVE